MVVETLAEIEHLVPRERTHKFCCNLTRLAFIPRDISGDSLKLSDNFLPTGPLLAHEIVKNVEQSHPACVGASVVDLRLRATVSRRKGRDDLFSHSRVSDAS